LIGYQLAYDLALDLDDDQPGQRQLEEGAADLPPMAMAIPRAL